MSGQGHGFQQFIITATNAFIDDASTLMDVVTAPARIVGNHVNGVLLDLETSSQEHLQRSHQHFQRSLSRAQVYQRFIGFKNRFASSTDREGKYVYHFLCGVEALPPGENEAMIQRITMYLDADPESAIKSIAQSMQNFSEVNLLKLTNRQMLALEN